MKLVLLLSVGLVAGQGYSSYMSHSSEMMRRKCEFIKREMQSGHKAWMSHQHWYQRLARMCNFQGTAFQAQEPVVYAVPAQSVQAVPAMPSLSIQVPPQVSSGLQHAVAVAKDVATSPATMKATAELKHDASKLAEKAKLAFEHQDTTELKEGASDFAQDLKKLWDKNTNEETKKKAALLMAKAKHLLGGQDLEEKVESGLAMAGQKVEEVQGMPETQRLKDVLGALKGGKTEELTEKAKQVYQQLAANKHAAETAQKAEKMLEAKLKDLQVPAIHL